MKTQENPRIVPKITERRLPKYEFEIFWPSSEPLNPDKDCADVSVRARRRNYNGTVITPSYIQYLFRKNASTGECAGGSYFCMPRMVVVKRIDRDTIKKTIDDLFRKNRFEEYFR